MTAQQGYKVCLSKSPAVVANSRSVLGELAAIAVDLFTSVLRISADHHGTFRLLVTAKIQGESKPLLLVGNAHAQIEDGHCIAIWNPDQDLVAEVRAGCCYSEQAIKSVVAKRCDAMLDLWIDAYLEDGVGVLWKYQARESKPPRFLIRKILDPIGRTEPESVRVVD